MASLLRVAFALLLAAAPAAWAGGSNYAVAPGARPNLVGEYLRQLEVLAAAQVTARRKQWRDRM